MVVASAYWLARRGRAPNLPAAVPAASSDAARPPRAAPKTEYLGVVLAERSIDLTAASPGRIESIEVGVGEKIAAGTVIARLDARRLARDLAIAEAALQKTRTEHEKAGVEVEQAKDRAERMARLAREAGLVSEQDLASAQYQQRLAAASLSGAVANVREQEVRVAQLRDALAEAQLEAPFAGVVAARYVSVGATVAAGERVVRIMTSDEAVVRFAVPEADAPTIAVGKPVSLRIEGRDEALAGRIASIAPDVDPPSQMIFVEATLSDPTLAKDSIVVGRAARVSIAER
jgi:RND family efflux transporter MFP subunit